MDRTTYEKLKAEAEAIRRNMQDAADLQYRTAIEDIERLYKHLKFAEGEAASSSSTSMSSIASSESSESSEGRRIKRGELAKAIRDALAQVPDRFTLNDIIPTIENQDPEVIQGTAKSSISSYLHRLENEGTIVVIQRGAGKRATIYSLRSNGSHKT